MEKAEDEEEHAAEEDSEEEAQNGNTYSQLHQRRRNRLTAVVRVCLAN